MFYTLEGSIYVNAEKQAMPFTEVIAAIEAEKYFSYAGHHKAINKPITFYKLQTTYPNYKFVATSFGYKKFNRESDMRAYLHVGGGDPIFDKNGEPDGYFGTGFFLTDAGKKATLLWYSEYIYAIKKKIIVVCFPPVNDDYPKQNSNIFVYYDTASGCYYAKRGCRIRDRGQAYTIIRDLKLEEVHE